MTFARAHPHNWTPFIPFQVILLIWSIPHVRHSVSMQMCIVHCQNYMCVCVWEREQKKKSNSKTKPFYIAMQSDAMLCDDKCVLQFTLNRCIFHHGYIFFTSITMKSSLFQPKQPDIFSIILPFIPLNVIWNGLFAAQSHDMFPNHVNWKLFIKSKHTIIFFLLLQRYGIVSYIYIYIYIHILWINM